MKLERKLETEQYKENIAEMYVHAHHCAPENTPGRWNGQKRNHAQQFPHKHLSSLFSLYQ